MKKNSDHPIGTEKQFGYEWNLFREIMPINEEQFRRWSGGLYPSIFKGKSFMDAGCGNGRNSFFALKAGAASGYAFDHDHRTVAAAKSNLEGFSNCEVAFRSIYDIDFQDRFDIVFSIGVVHCLADPRRALENLVRALKRGGALIVYVYAYEGNETYVKLFDPLRIHLTSRMPPMLNHLLAKMLACILKLYLLFPNKEEYFRHLQQMPFRNVEGIVFDQLIPSICHYWKRDEVLGLTEGLPLKNIRLVHCNDMSWTVLAEKA
ncbi:MAG: class I SAM-dependent methyltransferase [Pseudomonadota bacterium]